MLNIKCLGAVMVAATVFSSTAMANDRGVNTAVGAVIGAAIGHNTGGRDGALVGGVLGAVVGNAVSSHDRNSYQTRAYYDNRGYSDNRGYYDNRRYEPAPVYVEQRSYPVYYTPPARYYREPEVIYVEPRRGHGHHRGHWRDRDDRYGGYGYGR